MRTTTRILAGLLPTLLFALPSAAAPRLEIGPLIERLSLPGLRACFVARPPGAPESLRFLTTGASVFHQDPTGRLWPLLHRTNLFGVVTDPELGAMLCTSRGVFATRDGRQLRRISSFIFTRVVAAPVGGLFVRPGLGLYGFDGRQFHLILPIPWRTIESVAIEPGGAVWFIGSYRRADGQVSPTRLHVCRFQDGRLSIEDVLPPEESASDVAEYFGGIVATVDGALRGTVDGGKSWVTFDTFGRNDLTLTSVPLYPGEPWQALWIGVRQPGIGPAPLWYDNYAGLAAQPINADQVWQISADLAREVMLFIADESLFEAPYRVVQPDSGS